MRRDLFRQVSELRLRGQRGTDGIESFERASKSKRKVAVSLRRQLSLRELPVSLGRLALTLRTA